MDITFSDKYEPLFQLLEAWNVVKDPDFKEIYSKEEQEYWTKLSKVDTVLISGGRDSGKSYALSCFNGIAAAQFNHRILYTRQTMSSTDNSITEALENRLIDLGIAHLFEVANKTYTKKSGIGKISITGQKTSVGTQTAKLKSLEDFSIFETDEGEELESFDGWQKIKRSMRANDVQCVSAISFNPPTKEHWVFEQWYEDIPSGFNGIKNNVLYIHTTYLDNGRENMAEHNWLEYESKREAYEEYRSLPKEARDNAPKKLKKAHDSYKYEILGGFKEVAEGVIYEDVEIGAFDHALNLMCFGLDFGFSDEDALCRVAINEKKKLIYIKEELYKNNISVDELSQILISIVGYQHLVIGDSASPRLIKHIRDKGVNIEGSRKGKGSVNRGIKTMQGYTIIIDPDSPNVIKSFANYIWSNKRAGVPNHDWSHMPDAARYACMELITQ